MKLNKLAAGIVTVAIAATAINAPANAKQNKELNTLLAILAGGLVINEIIDRKKDRAEQAATIAPRKYRKYPRDTSVRHQHRDGRWQTHQSRADLEWYHRNDRDLIFDRDRKPDPKHRRPNVRAEKLPMPDRCERTIRKRNGKKIKAFSERCLRKMGYRVSNDGVVSHRKWRSLTRRPNLV